MAVVPAQDRFRSADAPNAAEPGSDANQPERLWREVVGEQIRQVRTDHGERLSDVAERAGVSPQYLSEIECGVKDPSSEVLSAVAGALGTDVAGLARRAFRLAPVNNRPGPAAGRVRGPVCLAA